MKYMYNTIEVISLEIKQAEIRYFKKSGFTSDSVENVRHVKVLPYLSVVQSVDGSYDITLGNGEKQQTGNGGFFIAPSEIQQTIVHHIDPKSGRMTCRWLFIDVEINKAYKLDSLYCFPVVIDDPVKKELNELFDVLFATDDLWENYSYCYKILGLLLKSSTLSKNYITPAIQNAVDYMVNNFASQIDVNKLANIANMSESNFYATFKKQFKTTPIAYLNHYRLSLAAEKIMESDRALYEICSGVGIADPLYFSKLFKRTYGMTPREYRLLHRNGSKQ